MDQMGLAPVSPLISIQVFESEQSPTIQKFIFGQDGQVDSIQDLELDSAGKFEFYPFLCSTGCVVTNYQISTS
jgi:hypothetical protein